MEWLLVLETCVDMPDAGLVEDRTPCLFLFALYRLCIAHADIPQVRKISKPSSVKRAFVHTGSHTISMCTCRTPGSCKRRSRMSSMMNSIAGQPIAVKV